MHTTATPGTGDDGGAHETKTLNVVDDGYLRSDWVPRFRKSSRGNPSSMLFSTSVYDNNKQLKCHVMLFVKVRS